MTREDLLRCLREPFQGDPKLQHARAEETLKAYWRNEFRLESLTMQARSLKPAPAIFEPR
jgi:hypothetical protein